MYFLLCVSLKFTETQYAFQTLASHLTSETSFSQYNGIRDQDTFFRPTFSNWQYPLLHWPRPLALSPWWSSVSYISTILDLVLGCAHLSLCVFACVRACVCPQGYTALHLASIHGHQNVVHALINTHSKFVSSFDITSYQMIFLFYLFYILCHCILHASKTLLEEWSMRQTEPDWQASHLCSPLSHSPASPTHTLTHPLTHAASQLAERSDRQFFFKIFFYAAFAVRSWLAGRQ